VDCLPGRDLRRCRVCTRRVRAWSARPVLARHRSRVGSA